MSWNYALASLVSYAGLLTGFFLMWISPEEQKSGTRYFHLMQHAILAIILMFGLYFHGMPLILNLVVSIAFLWLLSYLRHLKKPWLKSSWIYGILGVIFFFSFKHTAHFIVFSSMIFLYGLPTGSLSTVIKEKWKSLFNILTKHSLFLAASIGLYLLIT